MAKGPSNKEIATILERIADLLEIQGANPFRIRAYRNGAQRARDAEQRLADLYYKEGEEVLRDLPDIGSSLASVIGEYVKSGRSSLLARLQGEVSPQDLFEQVPGIGEELSERIADQLDVQTLEELELAAHDGRLGKVPGFGPQRVKSVRMSLAAILSGAAQRRSGRLAAGEEVEPKGDQPAVGTLLQVDATYRWRAEAGELKKIAPKRFNPENEAWLPIMHTEKESWSFTALYSNTARAHRLGMTHDWVVIYYERDGQEDQVTVVTETRGPLEGRRVVRGREEACQAYYAQEEPAE